MSRTRIRDEVLELLRTHPQGVSAQDIQDFRTKLKTGGHSSDDILQVLRDLRDKKVIRLRKQDGGRTRVSLRKKTRRITPVAA